MLLRSKTLLFGIAAGALALILIGPPIFHLARTTYRDRAAIEKLPHGYADDVSRMNKTRVAENWDVPSNVDEAERKLRELLHRAQESGLHVSIAGARHSMGGQTIYPGGININMRPLNGMGLDEARNLLHVQAGATWAEIIPYLDKHGRSIQVMQSDNAFTVGGSLSVNCHGWQYGRPPVASTVESFRLMKADGKVVRCSRSENKELFSLASRESCSCVVTGSSLTLTCTSLLTNGSGLSKPWCRLAELCRLSTARFAKSRESGWFMPG